MSIIYFVDKVAGRVHTWFMPRELQFRDESPICSECGCPCDDGFEERFTGQREADTGYQDEDVICYACLEEEGRYEAADAAYDMSLED